MKKYKRRLTWNEAQIFKDNNTYNIENNLPLSEFMLKQDEDGYYLVVRNENEIYDFKKEDEE